MSWNEVVYDKKIFWSKNKRVSYKKATMFLQFKHCFISKLKKKLNSPRNYGYDCVLIHLS
jgi:hypothetical protein